MILTTELIDLLTMLATVGTADDGGSIATGVGHGKGVGLALAVVSDWTSGATSTSHQSIVDSIANVVGSRIGAGDLEGVKVQTELLSRNVVRSGCL